MIDPILRIASWFGCVLVILFPLGLLAQEIKGVVTNEEDIILPGAQIYLLGREFEAQYANKLGDFHLPWPADADTQLLITRFVGYHPDTLVLTEPGYHHIRLQGNNTLQTVEVGGRKDGQYLSQLTPIKTEVVTSAELTKGACCDLAGCFNTNATVQANTTNVVTSTKELRLLGLGGVYNQILLDGFPMFIGGTFTYGMSTVPGAQVNNIYISKGANSVLQGHDGISGQINVETHKPEEALKAYGNVYLNSFGESQFNVLYSTSKPGFQNLAGIHIALPGARMDRDKDRFLDFPLIQRVSLMDRIQFGNAAAKGWSGEASLRMIHEERIGGQVDYQPHRHEGSGEVYGQMVRFLQPEGWFRLAYRINDQRRWVALLSGQQHRQDSWYGLLRYKAAQQQGNATLQFEQTWGNGHDLRIGVNGRLFRLDEDLTFSANPLELPHGGSYLRQDKVLGVFAEQISYFFDDRLTWIMGVRYDYHHQFHGRFTPRTLIKADLWENTSIRASVGYGWRIANVFTENIFLLASNRKILFEEALQPEEAWNAGLNLTQQWSLGSFTGRWGVDYYETRFSNQFFPDYQRSPEVAVIANFTQPSISRAFQTDLDMSHPSGWQMKFAYNYLDVYRVVDGKKETLPFNPRHKLLGVVSYSPIKGKWQGDAHVHWFGRQNLTLTDQNPLEHQRPEISDPYATITTQFTWKFTQWDIYGGCENILDFRQERPILSWQDPFSPYFDTSSAWGPTRGREFYLGIRWRIPKA